MSTAPPPNYNTNQNLHVDELLKKLKRGEFVYIEFIDIWGEGYLEDNGMITGFKNSYNLNKFDQLVSNPPDKGRQIPNLIPVDTYNSPFTIIPDRSVKYLALMGAPITALTASEMARIIRQDGNILIYGFPPGDQDRKTLEAALKKISFITAKEYTLSDEFAKITLPPIVVYTYDKNLDPNIYDEL